MNKPLTKYERKAIVASLTAELSSLRWAKVLATPQERKDLDARIAEVVADLNANKSPC